MKTRIQDNGYTITSETKGTFSGLQRCLTPTEVNYERRLKEMNLPYKFQHEIFECVEPINDAKALLAYRPESTRLKLTNMMKAKLTPQSNRLCSHLLETNRSIDSIPLDVCQGYINSQLGAGFDVISILDREKNKNESILESDIKSNIDKINNEGKIMRVVLDAALPNELFERKCQKAIDSGAEIICVKHASFFDNSANFYFMKKLAESGIHTQISGIERRLRKQKLDGVKLPPLSYPSFLAYFDFKWYSIRSYAWFPEMEKKFNADELRLFEMNDLGLYKIKDSITKHGAEFDNPIGFEPFADLNKQGIHDLADATEIHHPIYAYETAASRSELQSMTLEIKRNKFFEYASEKECLRQVVAAARFE